MEEFFAALGKGVLVIFVVTIVCTLLAYPTEWVVNYLINPALLHTLFNVSSFDFWHALCLNYLISMFAAKSSK